MSRLVVVLLGCLLAQALCVPAGNRRPNNNKYRPLRGDEADDINANEYSSGDSLSTTSTAGYDFDDDEDDDDDFGEPMPVSPSGGGSNLASLLNLASALLPSYTSASKQIRNVVREYFQRNPIILRRQDTADNVIEIDYIKQLTPPFLRQENDDNGKKNDESDDHDSNDDTSEDDNDDESSDESSEDNGNNGSKSDEKENDNAAEESVETNMSGNDKASKQDSGLNDGDDESDDSDYSDGGDGMGGGVLGLLAGLSGGENGESDLGSLLAAVSGIVGSLSGGEDFDLNSLVATGVGLFVGLLSQTEENPGQLIGQYLLTSLDTITEGGAKNNGEFFGKFLSTLIKGTSAVSNEESSEDGEEKPKMSDSGLFFASLLMGLSGDMSKGSSGGSSHPWRR